MSNRIPPNTRLCTCRHGKVQEMGIEDCGDCNGSGRDFRSDGWSEPCIKCNGSGRKTYCRWVECRRCHGAGYIPY